MKTATKSLLIVGIIILIVGAVILYARQNKLGMINQEVDQPLLQTGPSADGAAYSCNDSKSIRVLYTDIASAESSSSTTPGAMVKGVKVILSDGRSLELEKSKSADGERYTNKDESFIFWGKGNGALVLEDGQQKNYIGCIRVAEVPADSSLSKVYSNSSDGFSIRLPEEYTVDEKYLYQLSPGKQIGGVKFTIPASAAKGTNLSADSYVSIESLIGTKSCDAGMFLDGTHAARVIKDGDTTYSFASSSGAGAGNRYEESVYAIPGTNPCLAMRYYVHYSVFQNYPEGSVKEFDMSALLNQFDQIRKTLIIAR